jgi:ribosome recycling factor
MEELLTDSKAKMQKAIESFQNNLSKIRTGRANISLLDHISIDYYGTLTPLSQGCSSKCSRFININYSAL